MPHLHEKIDFTVEVFVVHNGKVLLRKHDKYDMWLSVGGHVELHEDPSEAAVREVKEEVGLAVTLHDTRDLTYTDERFRMLIPPISMNRHRINETHEHVSLIYFAKALTDTVIPEKPTDEWKWCTESELEGLRPDIQHYASRAIREVL